MITMNVSIEANGKTYIARRVGRGVPSLKAQIKDIIKSAKLGDNLEGLINVRFEEYGKRLDSSESCFTLKDNSIQFH